MKNKVIVYSLFGYGKERQANSFDFASYLRGLMINIRMNRLLFADWDIILETDQDTYAAFIGLFSRIGIIVRVNPPAPLCLAMLWRMRPIFERKSDLTWKYTHVLCRDLDSPPTYREAQAVQYWIHREKAMHAICDSVSHTEPLLGGMIGVHPGYFTERVAQTWEAMIELAGGSISFAGKGSDQTFLNRYIYPRFAEKGSDSITQHYFNGRGDSFLSDFKTCTCPPTAGHSSHCYNNIDIGLPAALKESNTVCGHIGAAGYYSTALFQFLRQHKDRFEDLLTIEKEYPKELFHWAHDGAFD